MTQMNLFAPQGNNRDCLLEQIPEILPTLHPAKLQFSTVALPQTLEEALFHAKVSKQGHAFALQLPQLDVKDYKIFKKLLASLNGYWNGTTHLFQYNPTAVISEIIHERKVPKVNPYSLFVTPDEIIEFLFEFMDLPFEDETPYLVLEPSAGTGAIARKIRTRFSNAHIEVAEIDPLNQYALNQQNFSLIAHDWLAGTSPVQRYDYAVMNPPFLGNQFIYHVLQALKALKPNRKLGAIVPASMLDKSDKKVRDFRNLVAEIGKWKWLGRVFPGTEVECLAIVLENLDPALVAETWTPTFDGHQSIWHEHIEVALDTDSDWCKFLETLNPSCSKIESIISRTLDHFVRRLIKDECCCFLYNDRVKQQLVQSVLQSVQTNLHQE